MENIYNKHFLLKERFQAKNYTIEEEEIFYEEYEVDEFDDSEEEY